MYGPNQKNLFEMIVTRLIAPNPPRLEDVSDFPRCPLSSGNIVQTAHVLSRTHVKTIYMYSNGLPTPASPGNRAQQPSADPAMWAGSYLSQREAAEAELAEQWDDVDMEEAEYVARHTDHERSTKTNDIVS